MWRGAVHRGDLHKESVVLPLHRQRGEAPGRSHLGYNALCGFPWDSPKKETLESPQVKTKLAGQEYVEALRIAPMDKVLMFKANTVPATLSGEETGEFWV